MGLSQPEPESGHPVRTVSLVEGLHCCLTSFGLRQFDGLIPDPEFRITSDGEVWNPVTPELLGWMLARIEIGLRSPTAGTSADLSQAIALFHEARDLSGLEPGRVPSAAWVPPGCGRKFPDISDPVTGIHSRYQVWRIEGLKNWCGKVAHSEMATA